MAFENNNSEQKKINLPLNLILYGPPGTGKTYKTIEIAVKIATPEFYEQNKNDRKALREKFEELKKQEQIAFVTFHQSMTYEDFVEGIKPDFDSEELTYKIEDGIFKRIVKKANKKFEKLDFDEFYKKFVEYVIDQGKIELNTPTYKKRFELEINSKKNCKINTSKTTFVVIKDLVIKYLETGEAEDWKPYTIAIGDFIKEKFSLQKYTQNSDIDKNYVLIIDEINRGNIASIFGELITLIEEDKRKGKKEALSATLPYSKQEFSVPDNLYIIGTMNTADRSVEALDTALRRRFTFEEMPPEYNVIDKEVDGIHLGNLLEAINQRIELLLDKDHLIGHSYFIGIENFDQLKDVFKNKIIPLLQEYFYNDLGKIGLILGRDFVQKEEKKNRFTDFEYDGYDLEDLKDKPIYKITSPEKWNAQSFKNIYS